MQNQTFSQYVPTFSGIPLSRPARFGVIAGVFVSAVAFLVTTIMSSVSLGVLFGVGVLLVTLSFIKPLWSVGLLFLYTPFEPFFLKFVPEHLYLYIRFGSEGLMYVLAIVVLFRILSGRVKWKLQLFDILFGLFLLSAFVGMVMFWNGATVAALGLRGIVRFMVMFYVLLYLRPTRKQILTAATAIFVILIFESVIGFAQAASGGALDGFFAPTESQTVGSITITVGTIQTWIGGQRIFATLGRYEQFGTWLMMFLLIGFAALYESFPQKYKRWILFTLGVGILALLLTYSRTSWFGFALGAGFIGVIIKKDKRLVYGAFILIASLMIYQQASSLVVNKLTDTPYDRISIVERFFETFSYERWRGEYRGLGRLYFFIETPRKVMIHSPVFGFGPGQYGSGAAAALHNTFVYNLAGIPFGVWGIYGHIDNSWLSLWGETGTVGLMLYIGMFVYLFYTSYKVYKESTYVVTRTLALGYMGIILAVAFASMLATFMEMRTLALYFWAIGGTVVALGYRERILKL